MYKTKYHLRIKENPEKGEKIERTILYHLRIKQDFEGKKIETTTLNAKFKFNKKFKDRKKIEERINNLELEPSYLRRYLKFTYNKLEHPKSPPHAEISIIKYKYRFGFWLYIESNNNIPFEELFDSEALRKYILTGRKG